MVDNEHYINPNIVTNNDFFNSMEQLLVCKYCKGLLNDPLECSNCELIYCKHCTTIPNICKDKCLNNSFNKKKIHLYLMEKLLVKCKACKKDFNLITYQQHLEECNKVDCLLCGNTKIKRSELKLRDCGSDLTKAFCEQNISMINELDSTKELKRTIKSRDKIISELRKEIESLENLNKLLNNENMKLNEKDGKKNTNIKDNIKEEGK